MKNALVYKLIASGFGLGQIKIQPKLIASLVAFLFAVFVKYFDNSNMLFLTLIAFGIIFSYISIIKLQKKDIQTNIVSNEVVGTWIAQYFFSPSLLLNLFAFFTFQIVSVFKPLFNNFKINSRYSISSMRGSILSGIISNSIVHAVLLGIYLLK